ncbi:MAG: ACP S-malonyltransferase [Defluviitaleaceae bacterium]|nr:ACP S-malonyltransferase [Defluviitaleaceae bacterium]
MNKTAIVFPGQGAQKVGMCSDFCEKFSSAKKIFDSLDANVKKIIFEGPQESLNRTLVAQPALFAADLACACALAEIGVEADGAAGFSLGEIPALVFGSVFDFSQGLEFVNFRAKSMQTCAEKNHGGMAAVIGISADEIISICAEIDGAWPANFNSATQTVVAFREDSFENLSKIISSQRGKIIRLAVSGAFHSPLMNDAAEEIKVFLHAERKFNFGEQSQPGNPRPENEFSFQKKPIYSNVTAQIYGDSATDLLSRHVNSPVKWRETIENMICDGFGTFIEAGPGKTLTGLIQKINPDVKIFNVFDLQSLENFKNNFFA